ncbi:MAG: tRNA (guanine(26)-N(2))-dimethyltransferase [Nanoarchaeota archaeon]|nr:tRNA (guanine(26)-N(2))-dimethyltransferase [Nanoarchaeota archaeon]
MITEGKAKINVAPQKIVSKKMEVFYNPVMELNRTSSVLVLNALGRKGVQLGLPLEGSGIRGIRLLKELKKGIIKTISFNDYDSKAVKKIKENLKLNKLEKDKRVEIFKKDATLFLLESFGFDYIDIDPFGTPNPFLDAALKRIARDGILAATATDTAPLSGTYPEACMRKYWALPQLDETMHETGIRILIRKVQLIGAQYDKALTPLFSFSKDHYMRVYFLCEKGKERVDEMMTKHGMLGKAGPLWLGQLWDSQLARKMMKASPSEHASFFKTIAEESEIATLGFLSIPSLCAKLKIECPKEHLIVDAIRKKGYQCAKTHFKENSLRTTMKEEDVLNLIKKLNR